MSWIRCNTSFKKELQIDGFSVNAPNQGGAYASGAITINTEKYKNLFIEKMVALGSSGSGSISGDDGSGTWTVIYGWSGTINNYELDIKNYTKIRFAFSIGQASPVQPGYGGSLTNIVFSN